MMLSIMWTDGMIRRADGIRANSDIPRAEAVELAGAAFSRG